MEKYYLTKIDELNSGQSAATSRLLEVQFLRRPPTIGLLFAGKTEGQKSSKCCWSIKLATLSLNNENKAKFSINREVPLTGVVDGGNSSPAPIVSLDTYNRGQLLIEGAHISAGSSTSKAFEHLMSSSVFALTQTGQIWAVSMLRRDIDGGDSFSPAELLKECKPSRNVPVTGQNKFLELQVQSACISQDSTSNTSWVFHVLSRQCYFAYTVRRLEGGSPPPGGATAPLTGTRSGYLDRCELVLEQEFSIVASAATTAPPGARHLLQPVELTRVLPMHSSDASVLLESSDGSLRVIRQGRCIWTIEAPTNAAGWPQRSTTMRQLPRQGLMLLQSREAASGACENIALSLTSKNRLVAHSLSINSRAREQAVETTSDQHDSDMAMIEGGGDDDPSDQVKDTNRDPDRLLPREPSFELEECWSIELDELVNSISGVLSQSVLDTSDDDDDNDAGGGYLCVPLWLPQSSTAAAAAAAASAEDQSTRRWPQFLLLFHKVHVLIFSFEQEDDTLPFSVVYDRAFLNLTGGIGESDDQKPKVQAQRVEKRVVDLHARPRLLHNIKLVGIQPSDCLFNLMFLSSRGAGKRSPACVSQARHFNQLNLMAAITSEGHVLAFKLTSPQVVEPNRKDNLYQQLLLDSLRDESLLRDELARLQEISLHLREDTIRLEGMLETVGQGAAAAAAECEKRTTTPTLSSAGMLRAGGGQSHLLVEPSIPSREIRVRLEHHALVGGLYELSVEWPGSVFGVLKVIVCSTVDGSEILPPLPGSLIENVQVSGNNRGSVGELFSSHQDNNAALMVLGLKSGSDESPAVTVAASESMKRVQLTLFLQDTGQTAAGRVKVYVIFCEKTLALQAKSGMDAYNHQLLSRKSSHFDYLQQELEMSSQAHHSGKDHSNFILQELPVKPLMSYRLLTPQEQDDSQTNLLTSQQMDTLEASGPYSGEQLLAWLDELLNIEPRGDQPTSFKFRSNLTGCSLDVKIEQVSAASSRDDQSATLRMLVTSQDLDALDLIKRHTLKRATDNSIRLAIQQSGGIKRPAREIDEHRRKNSQLVESVKRTAAAWNERCPPPRTEESRNDSSCLTPTQRDMLLDNLLGEMDQMLEVNGGADHFLFGQAEPMKFTNFLKRSLRQDVEQLFGQ